MTLVAAFTSHGRPTLIGDLLLTNSQTLEGAGTRRKLLKINTNLVVGWCDSMLGARFVCRELRENLPDNASPDQLHKLLRAQIADLREMHVGLVGWLYHMDRWQAFEWCSEAPESLRLGTYAVLGSGEKVFRNFVKPDGLNPPRAPKDAREASQPAIYIAANLVADDLSGRRLQREHRFGVAYDIWMAEERNFRTVGSVTYAAVSVRLSAEDEVIHIHTPHGLLMHCDIEECVVYQHYDGSTKVTRLNVVTPILDGRGCGSDVAINQVRDLVSRGRCMSFQADWLSLVVQFYVHSDRPWPLLVGALQRGSRWSGDERGVIVPGPEFLSSMAKMIARDLRATGRMP